MQAIINVDESKESITPKETKKAPSIPGVVDAGGGIANAVKALKKRLGHMTKIELEVRNLDELNQALEAKVDVIMLDNMSCEMMKEAVEITNGRALLEASGGITKETLRNVALTGVDIISIGALTHSVQAFDISLKIVK